MSEQRLIDANTFEAYSFNVPKQYDGQAIAYIDGACSVLEKIDDAPTIAPETLPIVRELQEKLEQVTAERDVAIADLKYIASCECCAYGCKNLEVDHCFDCGEKECRCRNCLGGDCWEWRGLVAENATTYTSTEEGVNQ